MIVRGIEPKKLTQEIEFSLKPLEINRFPGWAVRLNLHPNPKSARWAENNARRANELNQFACTASCRTEGKQTAADRTTCGKLNK
jgi:hypothetical protein